MYAVTNKPDIVKPIFKRIYSPHRKKQPFKLNILPSEKEIDRQTD